MIQDIKTRQRALNLAGYNAGTVDGIAGPKTRAAQDKWNIDAEKIAADVGTFDPRTEKNLRTLLPAFQRATRQWLQQAIPTAAKWGYSLKIICGTRDFAEQTALYAKGRTTTGPRVTNARAGSSFHNYGCAFDIGLFATDDGTYITSGVPYKKLLETVPFDHPSAVWGGSFKSFKDYPHIEWHGAGSTTQQLRTASEK